MKWVKASERLPEHDDYVPIKRTGYYYTAWYQKSKERWITDSADEEYKNEDVEWLDETHVPPDWVSVDEGLPEESGQVLVCLKDTEDIYVSYYKKEIKVFQVWGAGYNPILDMKVTHWMPKPQPPKPTNQ